MRKKALPSPDVLRQILRYKPCTGELRWRQATPEMFSDGAYSAERKCRAWNGKYSGKPALCHQDPERPYSYGEIFGVKCYAHRAILAMMTGEWPDEVDHINGDKSDNRLTNLRAVSRSENMKNTSLRSDNTSGVTGVYFDKSRCLWAAEILAGGKRSHLGRYRTKKEAVLARKAAEIRFGFHANHGRVGVAA